MTLKLVLFIGDSRYSVAFSIMIQVFEDTLCKIKLHNKP